MAAHDMKVVLRLGLELCNTRMRSAIALPERCDVSSVIDTLGGSGSMATDVGGRNGFVCLERLD